MLNPDAQVDMILAEGNNSKDKERAHRGNPPMHTAYARRNPKSAPPRAVMALTFRLMA